MFYYLKLWFNILFNFKYNYEFHSYVFFVSSWSHIEYTYSMSHNIKWLDTIIIKSYTYKLAKKEALLNLSKKYEIEPRFINIF